jgi:hypothetical protein
MAVSPKKFPVFNKKQDNKKIKYMCHFNKSLPSHTLNLPHIKLFLAHENLIQIVDF